jgi:hypothetical protein
MGWSSTTSAAWVSPRGVAVDSNGSVVVAGISGDGNLFIVRYLEDGSRDSSFSGDGVVTGGLPPALAVSSVAVDSQDRDRRSAAPVIGGLTEWFAARYLANGTLDTSFGGDGVVGLQWLASVLGGGDR